MIVQSISAALASARFEEIEDEEPWYGEIPELRCVWATGTRGIGIRVIRNRSRSSPHRAPGASSGVQGDDGNRVHLHKEIGVSQSRDVHRGDRRRPSGLPPG